MDLLIPGVPVADEKNRVHALLLGLDAITWPQLPPGSVHAHCADCGGAVQLDPGSEQIRQALTGGGGEPFVVCLLCVAAVYGTVNGAAACSADDRLQRFKERLRRLREEPDEAARIDQIIAEVAADSQHEGQ